MVCSMSCREPVVDNHRVHAFASQQVRQHQARRTASDDADGRTGNGPHSQATSRVRSTRGTSRRLVSSLKPTPNRSRTTMPSGLDVEDGVVGVDPANAGEAGQRVGALRYQLGLARLGEQGHHHVTSAWRRWPGPSRRRRPGCRPGWPVCQLARSPSAGDLVGAEHADVEVAAAHHREGVGVVEVRRARQLGHRELARVDQVRVDLVAVRGRGPCRACRSRCAG